MWCSSPRALWISLAAIELFLIIFSMEFPPHLIAVDGNIHRTLFVGRVGVGVGVNPEIPKPAQPTVISVRTDERRVPR